MGKRILIAPLDWGLGHATRCVPLIRYILETGNEPIIAASGRPLKLLRSEFPNVEFIDFEGYNISYPEGSGMVWKMFQSTPHILRRIKEEHEQLQQLVDKHQLDAVISDNRFGLYTHKVPCVYMTHQVMIKTPFFEKVLYRLHLNYMRKFSQVWVPDHEENGLSGDLAHKYPLPFNGQFIGPLSRFIFSDTQPKRDVLVLISGPEPQRTRFEELVLSQLKDFDGSAMVVLGTPEHQESRKTDKGHDIVPHLPANELEQEISASKMIISRSGYSTIMDLAVLGKKAVFVPTPGQTEQEFLASVFHQRKQHLRMKQRQFNLEQAIADSQQFTGFEASISEGYRSAIDELLKML